MTASLAKGQNGPLSASTVVVAVRSSASADLSALLVTDSGKVRTDADFVFFNQPDGPGVQLQAGPPAALVVSLAAVPADISQVRAVLTLEDTSAQFGSYPAPIAQVTDSAGNLLYEYRIDGLSSESIVIALELYRRGSEWKVRAVGQGYAGGFAALVTDHGVSVDDEPASTPVQESGVRTVANEAKLSLEKRQKLDLRKSAVAKVLLEKKATGVRARVVLVIDKTGSMSRMYKQRVVHRVVERMVPVATQIDDDGQLEPYLYGSHFARLPDIAVHEVEGWSEEFLHLTGTHGGIDYKPIGGYNDELPIMNEIIASLRAGDSMPTLVLFFTDGGFSKRAEISALMSKASALPAFWQFVGLGKANYGVLEKLDTMEGRTVDNAGFFALDDIDTVDDQELYRRLLSEFPDWLRAAKSARIVG
ncbi:vWA domain-containing protein [Antrihabitans spumae]|uniref:VWA domain-containing protein n=1 Tax=Antrihabitans spumae TaxID=3373370 RepID=A0ABW7JL87_9NOCA